MTRPKDDAQAPPAGTSAEAELIQRLLGGDEQAFAGLVNQHHAVMVRLARFFVSTQASAEEVVQETWVAVLSGLPRFQGRSSLKTWIFRILSNRAKTRGVRDGRSVPMSSLGKADGEAEPSVDPDRFNRRGGWSAAPQRWEAETPEQVLIHGEVMTLLEQAIADLPPSQGAVITMRDVQGFSSAEVCNVLEVSETNQRVLLHRARSKVRSALEGYYHKAGRT